MKRILLAVVVATLALGATGLAQALGTRDNPIIMVFIESTKIDVIAEVAPKIAQALSEATGLVIQSTTASYTNTTLALATAKGNTFGIPATDAYVQAVDQNPGVHARLTSLRKGYDYYFATIYALREKGYVSVQDLAGKEWAFAHRGSASGYKIPSGYFAAQGVTVVEKPVGSITNAMIAILEGQADFATGYGSPPVPPAILRNALTAAGWRWGIGMDPEMWLWDRYNNALWPEGLRGECVDVRWAIATEVKVYGDIWELVEKVSVVDVVGPIPNDALAFCEGFPKDIEDILVEAVRAHVLSPEGAALWGRPGFYEWDDTKVIDDSYFDNYRIWVGLPIPQR